MRGRQTGSSTVEFALVLPLVLIVLLAMLQVGLVMVDRLLVSGAARAGAREAAVRMDEDSVREAAVSAGGLDPDRVLVEVSRAGGAGDPVTVTVRYESRLLVPLVSWLFPDRIGLTARVTMRQEVDDG